MNSKPVLDTLVVGPIETNCYLLRKSEESREAVVIDPGDEADYIIKMLKTKDVIPAAILLTHGHFDHTGAVGALTARYPNLPVYLCEKEAELAATAALNNPFSPASGLSVTPTVLLHDGDVFTCAGIEFRVLETPGHTIGSCCYSVDSEKLLFSGDTIFYQSCGRVDLPTGSVKDMRNSLRTVLTSFPEDTRVLPGHGPATTIGAESIRWRL